MKKVSIVIPAYNESGHLQQSIDTILHAVQTGGVQFNVVLVDDGSRDTTWQIIEALCKEHSNIAGVKLSRNFGKEAAICAGLEHCHDVDGVVLMDSDLQHPPTLVPELIAKWQEGYDVVEAVKADRGKESLVYKIGAKTFYSVFTRFAGLDLSGASDFKFLNRQALDAWKAMPEKETFFRGMSAWIGFQRAEVPFEVAERTEGTTKFSLKNLVRLFVSAVSAYTSLPLHVITLLGLVLFVASIVLGIWTLYVKLTGQALNGITTVILLQLIIGSSIMFGLGTIGIYLSKIYNEIKSRPRYIASKTINL